MKSYTSRKDASLGSYDGLSGVSRLEAAGEGTEGEGGTEGGREEVMGEERRKTKMVLTLEIHE